MLNHYDISYDLYLAKVQNTKAVLPNAASVSPPNNVYRSTAVNNSSGVTSL